MAQGKLFVVSGPSGVGKTTVVEAAIERLKDGFKVKRVVTYTSREPREGEVAGVDYNYIAPEEFKKRAEEGFFAEWSTVYGTYYGTPLAEITGLEENEICILVIDRVGAEKITKSVNGVAAILILPPSLEELHERLLARGLNNEEQIESRLEIAVDEMEAEEASRLYQYYVVNDDFNEAVAEMESVVLSEMTEEH